MLKKKSSSGEKKRKHAPSDERHRGSKHKSAESNKEDAKDELADAELDRVGSDIEEGGLDLGVPFQPITAYVSDKKEMLEQCFRVLGEKKLRRMLPEEFKDFSLEEIQKLCWQQLEPISERNIVQILSGEQVTEENIKNTQQSSESQRDNNIVCVKEATSDNTKQEVSASSEDSDVLSINADTSDIEAPKDEQPVDKNGAAVCPPKAEAIQNDIDRSVSEILASKDEEANKEGLALSVQDVPSRAVVAANAAKTCPPSLRQLELLELEMRARAIKALMKASNGKAASQG
ncbi:caspase activity and apoptosis inhibitor 1 [Dunckerocampus dactyliophorus]|uniref:caspase activity and apoptosis inhibitor 1 n=1 Tax=Dunckerocampus dactyliophorus TaxID=161453 RepID=UPI0024068D0F|nr:caspase activity and apoptosis inhibitor 1 [Dunckerocampus dactyliophorus]